MPENGLLSRTKTLLTRLWQAFIGLDRRVVYFLTGAVILAPVITGWELTPPYVGGARKLFQYVETLAEHRDGRVVLLSMDFGPQTRAELEPAARALIKHLFFRRIPVVIMTLISDGRAFTEAVPESARKAILETWQANPPQDGDADIVYGRDYINLGYQVGGSNSIRGMAENIKENVKTDAGRRPLASFPILANATGADSVCLMAEFTGLVGFPSMWLQFFKQTKPMKFSLSCTSISVPEAYTYLDSGQYVGLIEGITGAAAYERLLEENLGISHSPKAYKDATVQIVGQAFIVLLVAIGNAAYFIGRHRGKLQ